jgi:CHAT domain-containing protein
VLSASETAMPGLKLPDEVIGLPASLLESGFGGVIGSLWNVPDVSTALLMERFYEAWRSEGHDPPKALQHAQQWLRDSTGIELYGRFRDLGLQYEPTSRPFNDPYYWSAFVFVGV